MLGRTHAGATAPKGRDMAEMPDLVGSWVHSHEEDGDGVVVFRPAGYPLPPARGRDSFTLQADGTAAVGTPGPDDRGASDTGRWVISGSALTVHLPHRNSAYDVLSVEPAKLSLRPEPDRTEPV